MFPKIRQEHGDRSMEGIVVCPEKQSAVSRFFQPKLAVVVVKNGESQEDAWRRHLAENPKNAGTRIRIFHFSRPLKREGGEGGNYQKSADS